LVKKAEAEINKQTHPSFLPSFLPSSFHFSILSVNKRILESPNLTWYLDFREGIADRESIVASGKKKTLIQGLLFLIGWIVRHLIGPTWCDLGFESRELRVLIRL
jgi:hypothetical protein